MSLRSFLIAVEGAPVTVTNILLCIFVFSYLSVDSRWEYKQFCVGFKELLISKQLHRILTFPLCHANIAHVLLTITTLWGLRCLEGVYGSLFVLKYSIVLALFEVVSTMGAIYFIMKISPSQLSLQQSVSNISIYGFTSIILGWLGFLSIDLTLQNKTFILYIYGVAPVPVPIAPLILLLIGQCILPRGHSISHASGLFGGYLLALGVLKILPNLYWTILLGLDLLIIIIYYYAMSNDENNSNASGGLTMNHITAMNDDSVSLPVISLGGDVIVLEESNNPLIESTARDSDFEGAPLLARDDLV